MAINKAMKIALKALSYPDLDIKKNYKIHRQINTAMHPYLKPRYKIWDHTITGIDHEIPVRIFMPSKASFDKADRVLIFFMEEAGLSVISTVIVMFVIIWQIKQGLWLFLWITA